MACHSPPIQLVAEIPREGYESDQGETPTDPLGPDLDLVRRLGILLERILAGKVVRRARERGGEEGLAFVKFIWNLLFIQSLAPSSSL